MLQGRSLIACALLVGLTGIPALACLPNPDMTQAEMACCKKMKGDCQMGTRQHPCCKRVNSPPVASIDRSVSQVQPPAVAVLFEITHSPNASVQGVFQLESLGLPPPSPPAPNSILRI